MTIQNWTDREEYINLIWLVVNRRRGGGEKNSEWNEEGEVEMPRTEGQEGKIIYKTFNNRRRKKTLELKKEEEKKKKELSSVKWKKITTEELSEYTEEMHLGRCEPEKVKAQ